ncbi:MAG: hypothetical protein VX218_08765 [Pseudomonadota bacterium]|nr:hypothetical protein [Pseudomonadota bacterium]
MTDLKASTAPAAGTLSGTDRIIGAQGSDDVHFLLSAIAAFAAEQAVNRQTFAPASSGTVNIANSNAKTIIAYLNFSGSISGLTVNFPTLPTDGQKLAIRWRDAASAITLASLSGSILGGYSSAGANAHTAWEYHEATNLWWRGD